MSQNVFLQSLEDNSKELCWKTIANASSEMLHCIVAQFKPPFLEGGCSKSSSGMHITACSDFTTCLLRSWKVES